MELVDKFAQVGNAEQVSVYAPKYEHSFACIYFRWWTVREPPLNTCSILDQTGFKCPPRLWAARKSLAKCVWIWRWSFPRLMARRLRCVRNRIRYCRKWCNMYCRSYKVFAICAGLISYVFTFFAIKCRLSLTKLRSVMQVKTLLACQQSSLNWKQMWSPYRKWVLCRD